MGGVDRACRRAPGPSRGGEDRPGTAGWRRRRAGSRPGPGGPPEGRHVRSAPALGDGGDGPVEVGVVDVLVGDQADGRLVDGAGPDALGGEVGRGTRPAGPRRRRRRCWSAPGRGRPSRGTGRPGPRPGGGPGRGPRPRRSTISVRATIPAAAMTPAWRMPPPRRARSRRAAAMRSAEPASIDPTGADRPLERQNMTVSTGAASAGGVDRQGHGGVEQPGAVAVDGQPVAAGGGGHRLHLGRRPRHAPGRHVGVLQATRPRGGRWWAGPSAARSTAAGSKVPSRSWSGRSWTPALRAAAPASYWRMWARAGQSTSVPGRVRSRRAIWLPIVPDGT